MRTGIIAAGTWLADLIKFIPYYPAPGNLVSIEKEEVGLGGCAHNVLMDLAKLQSGLPLYAAGCIGKRCVWGLDLENSHGTKDKCEIFMSVIQCSYILYRCYGG